MEDVLGASYSNQTVSWNAEPSTRGTFSLLSSSFFTLLLCVYSAVHLNLPGQKKDDWSLLKRRLKWIIVGLFFPEYLVITAATQWKRAKRIFLEAQAVFKSSADDSEQQAPRRRHAWTMTHSYWAIMGGIGYEDRQGKRFLPEGSQPLLTINGISMLLRYRPDLLPDIPEIDIKDKSKGGAIVKFLACAQANWFCISCTGHMGQKLPLSQFELNTFAHAICTVVVYTLWW
ncbi:hypothetical protein QBC35DRAFT_550636 [Podospora australis]|uniref:Uncharacterized protein n=1 Tax=Podospora australis TaxID=1536484 RepID=A0AAN6WTI2_9PEZI|nr:hypothetical protein QBC35DRAFT_550636 [Podospora australis]